MTQLHPLQTRIGIVTNREDRDFRFPAPATVPGLYTIRNRKYFRQSEEWAGTFVLADGATERRIRFQDKTVRVYTDRLGREFWTYTHHRLAQWLVMTPSEVDRCQRYLKARAARNAQRRAEAAQAAQAA